MVLTALLVVVGVLIASVAATELLRSVVERHRVRTRGVGGTQDVLICGTVVTLLLEVATVGLLLLHLRG